MTTRVLLIQSFAGGGRWSVGDDHQSLTRKGKNRWRSLERKGEGPRKGAASAGQVDIHSHGERSCGAR
jgi:hypothetical protein